MPEDIATRAPRLSVDNPGTWADHQIEELFAIPRHEFEPIQLEALRRRFDSLKGQVAALEKLVDREGQRPIEKLGDALPYYFDHRVYKSYPVSLIETRDFPKLTRWLNRLTTHDLLKMDLSGLVTLDDWLTRLDEFGMLVGHSTGTTGKLSFIPRSQAELPAWKRCYDEAQRAASGLPPGAAREHMPTFSPGYRGGHQMALKMIELFSIDAAGGPENYHTLYPGKVSSDLLSLAARLQSADDRNEIAQLGLDPALLKARDEMMAQGRRRGEDLEAWFTNLIENYRGQKVIVGGNFGDLVRVAQAGISQGLKPSFAPGSVLMSGGGLKGVKDAPADWEGFVKDYFGIPTLAVVYSMSELMGIAPRCSQGFYHYPPHVILSQLDADDRELPREGVQTGRLAVFDLLAETYWGGFISGDQVTVHWDDNCDCGWKGPRITKDIRRFAEMEGGDDKITCAGTQQAYDEFIDFVMQV